MDPFENFILEHWPRLVSRVARLEGMIAVGVAVAVAMLGIMIKNSF